MSVDPSPPGPRFFLAAAALLTAGTLLRLAALAHAPPINIDEVRYLLTAHHVAVGAGYSDWRGPETHIHPAHPLLTAALAGSRPQALESCGRVVTFTGSVLFMLPMTALAFRLGGKAVALLGLAFIALHPALARAAATVEPEGLYILAISLALLLLPPLSQGPVPIWRWGVAGVLFGLAYLARPEGLPVGLLAGSTAAFLDRANGRHRNWSGLVLLLGALLLTASPFLLFIHRVTGEWSLTGKTLELFFIGQGLRETGGVPPDFLRLRELERQWGGILPFLWANPRSVLEGAALNARGIFGRVLPGLLGPVGLLGLMGFLLALPSDRDLRRKSLLLLTPCLTLLLMLFTFPNSRVVGTVVPFFLISAAFGWLHWLATLIPGRKLRLGLAIAILGLGGILAWTQTLGRVAASTWWETVTPERDAAGRALELAGNSLNLASNDPVLSFYAGEPALFGPPGIYRPLPGAAPCKEMESILRERDAKVAILSGRNAEIPAGAPSADCSLRVVFETRRHDGRPLRVFALEPDIGVAPR
jgi:4-amino-4-deoxy-L-arabinose transferase-like glycosyltransferase